MYYVYRHISPSNKIYIGITSKKPEYRWSNGNGYKANKYFYRAIQKYGWDNFKHEILFEGLTKKEACQKEIEFIRLHHSNDTKYGYNLSSGGEHIASGCKHSEETIRKLSELAKNMSAETRRKLSEAWENRVVSEETRRRMSEAAKKRSDENKTFAKRMSPEYKEYKKNGGQLKWKEYLKKRGVENNG